MNSELTQEEKVADMQRQLEAMRQKLVKQEMKQEKDVPTESPEQPADHLTVAKTETSDVPPKSPIDNSQVTFLIFEMSVHTYARNDFAILN